MSRSSAATLAAISTMALMAGLLDAHAGTQPFRITSTLAGKRVLPHRLHWLARPSLPAAKVLEVDFLIDGRLAWVEHNPPYSYGDDGNWLVTSWLAPGSHRFTVRARASGGSTATSSTTAEVRPAPPAPKGLDGTRWTRVTKALPGGGPAGTWTLMIDRTGWKVVDPNGEGAYLDVAYLAPGTLETRGGIWTKPHNPYEGNAWCEDSNAPVRLSWRLVAKGLALHPIGTSRCSDLGPFFSTTWKRAG